jgi:hypothetical protein
MPSPTKQAPPACARAHGQTKGSNEASLDHAVANRVRKSKASRAAASHRLFGNKSKNLRYMSLRPSKCHAIHIITSLCNIKNNLPHYKVPSTAMFVGRQPTTGTVTTLIQSGTSAKIFWRLRSTQIRHVLRICDSSIGRQ